MHAGIKRQAAIALGGIVTEEIRHTTVSDFVKNHGLKEHNRQYQE